MNEEEKRRESVAWNSRVLERQSKLGKCCTTIRLLAVFFLAVSGFGCCDGNLELGCPASHHLVCLFVPSMELIDSWQMCCQCQCCGRGWVSHRWALWAECDRNWACVYCIIGRGSWKWPSRLGLVSYMAMFPRVGFPLVASMMR
jgi:hypothetical protein